MLTNVEPVRLVTRDWRIPDAALLQPEDVGGAAINVPPGDLWPYLRPPQPRGGSRPSAGPCRASRTVSAVYPVDEQPTVIMEYVARYAGHGAQRYLRGLRRALDGGAGDAQGGHWWILESDPAGPDSLLIRLRRLIKDNGGQDRIHCTYLVVARVGGAILVVADVGWEAGDGHRTAVRGLAQRAVQRAEALR